MSPELFFYLQSVRSSAITAECARESLQRAEHDLTRVATANAETITSHTVDYDRIALRVAGYQAVRERAAKDLHESVGALKEFRSMLDECGLGEDEQALLWARHVLGVRDPKELAKAGNLAPHHGWMALGAAEKALGAYLFGE